MSLPAQALGDVFSAFAAALGAADKVIELIQREPKMPDAGSLQPPSFSGRLELQDVSFSYPSRPNSRVLDGISLRVNPGEVRTRPSEIVCLGSQTPSACWRINGSMAWCLEKLHVTQCCLLMHHTDQCWIILHASSMGIQCATSSFLVSGTIHSRAYAWECPAVALPIILNIPLHRVVTGDFKVN